MCDLFMRASAVFSPCRTWRYRLGREWGDGPRGAFVMLNPSTADEWQEDRTIRRCIGFARREGWGSLTVLNAFAFRATDPRVMRAAADPVGPENDDHLRDVAAFESVVVAWGADRMMRDRAPRVLDLIGREVLCLNTTKLGFPVHPLYRPGDEPLMPYRAG